MPLRHAHSDAGMLAVAAQSGTHLAQLGVTDGDCKTEKRRAISADLAATGVFATTGLRRPYLVYLRTAGIAFSLAVARRGAPRRDRPG